MKLVLNSKWFYVIFWSLILILFVSRAMPYWMHGPFGFGYDVGIYKHVFEGIRTLPDVLGSEVYPFPSFLAYLVNLLGLPVDWLLYHAHILFSVLVVVPLYFLTKDLFGKVAGLLAIVIFTISYTQVFGSEFYLYKAELGAIFMLASLLFYMRRSYWFFLFVVLLGLTQLPQYIVMVAGIGTAAFFGLWKDYKYNFLVLLSFVLAFDFVAILSPHHIWNAWDVVQGSLLGEAVLSSHHSGLFISLREFLGKESVVFLLAASGFVLTLKKKGVLALQASLAFVTLVVVARLFFENRFVLEMHFLLIPFAAYFIYKVFKAVVEEKGLSEKVWALGGVALVFISGYIVYGYYLTTRAALSEYEQWALQVINEKEDSKNIMVSSSIYAPWAYGFSGKTTLAPGIFSSVWSYEDQVEYFTGEAEDRALMLLDIAKKRGKFYLFEGQSQDRSFIEAESECITKIFDVGDATVYEVIPCP
ncbi:hypothetical protein HOE67_01890 [Candidatus Peregrinibacteria bacterium]|jgi:hypothetical protein|nr:hypothetical protein [Candidatus Peregrinibacteria bacterium]MBT4055839.1 hypothetical protein [Candidatus Peregrinibacteria bacterium]